MPAMMDEIRGSEGAVTMLFPSLWFESWRLVDWSACLAFLFFMQEWPASRHHRRSMPATPTNNHGNPWDENQTFNMPVWLPEVPLLYVVWLRHIVLTCEKLEIIIVWLISQHWIISILCSRSFAKNRKHILWKNVSIYLYVIFGLNLC